MSELRERPGGLPVSQVRPMSGFRPERPALLHDQLNDIVFDWLATPELVESWQRYATPHERGVIAWDGLLLDGWAAPDS